MHFLNEMEGREALQAKQFMKVEAVARKGPDEVFNITSEVNVSLLAYLNIKMQILLTR